jgi:cell division protein FtsN
VLAACSRQEAGWRDARGEDSVLAYETYLEHFPAGAHAAEARARIRELHEEREWARANQLQTPEAWQRYLGAYPEGRYAATARERLSDFLLARAPPADRHYAVQLGAYSSEAAAGTDLARLARDHADLLKGVRLHTTPPGTGTPRLWRLRAGPFTEAAARRMCAELSARAVDCVPAVESEIP